MNDERSQSSTAVPPLCELSEVTVEGTIEN